MLGAERKTCPRHFTFEITADLENPFPGKPDFVLQMQELSLDSRPESRSDNGVERPMPSAGRK
jgi:hypothetical protein